MLAQFHSNSGEYTVQEFFEWLMLLSNMLLSKVSLSSSEKRLHRACWYVLLGYQSWLLLLINQGLISSCWPGKRSAYELFDRKHASINSMLFTFMPQYHIHFVLEPFVVHIRPESSVPSKQK